MNTLIDPRARLVIAHRGASAYAPENTIAAFEKAAEQGADAIELDVRLTRDGSVVVIHDPDVDRTTDGHGLVASMTLSEVRRLDAGARFTRDDMHSYPFRACNVRIPTFDEVLERFREIPLLVELKEIAVATPAATLAKQHGAADRVVFASELAEATRRARLAGIASGASRPDAVRLLRRAFLGLSPGALDYRALCIPWQMGRLRMPVRRMARCARRANVATHAWTVNSTAVAERLWRGGVNGIVTDDPVAMLRLREELAG
jgi:glycerophosphoryl diester phosphodiesterase